MSSALATPHYRGGLERMRSSRLGEVIRWGPLGPGGDPAASLQSWSRGVQVSGLGAVEANTPGPDQEWDLRQLLGQLDATEQMVAAELAEAYARGDRVDALTQQHQLVVDQLVELTASIDSLQEHEIEGWVQQARSVQQTLDAMTADLQKKRASAESSTELRGALWGAGAVAVVAGVAVWMFTRKKKRRRR